MLRRFTKDEDGAVMIEMTLVMTILFLLTLGFVDFAHAFYQWNRASKAVQVGARMASISEPVAAAVATRPWGGNVPGSPTGGYGPYECSSAGCTLSGNASGFNSVAFNRIFRGDVPVANDDSCAAPTGTQRRGMCHFFPGLRRADVFVTYTGSGLGYQARVDGAVPTITVEIRNVNFQLFFVAPLLQLASSTISMPTMLSTVTGEDLTNGPPS